MEQAKKSGQRRSPGPNRVLEDTAEDPFPPGTRRILTSLGQYLRVW
jgi:hypothetical protein